MFKIVQAMLWEQWRISRMELLLRAVFLFLFLGLVVLVARRMNDPAGVVLQGIVVFLIGFIALFSASWTQDLDSRQLGFTYALGFTRPITTPTLVLVPLMYSLVLSQIFYVGSVVSINWLLGWSLPLWGPAAIIASTVCLLIAGAWSPTRIDGRIAGMVGAISLTLLWLSVRNYMLRHGEPVLMAIGRKGYFDLTWYEYLGLATVACLAVGWTIQSVYWQRHGDTVFINLLRWGSAEEALSTREPNLVARGDATQGFISNKLPAARLRSFHNSLVAQVWYEWRRSAPLCLMGLIVLPFAFFGFLCLNTHWELAPRAWMGALIALPIILQFLAVDCTAGITAHQNVVRYSAYDATRPMRCDQMIAIKVLVVFGWSLCGLTLTALLAGFYALLSGEYEFWLRDFRAIKNAVGEVATFWWIVGGVNLLLAFLGVTNLLYTQVLFLARFSKLCIAAALIFVSHVFFIVWDATHGWQWLLLWKTYGFAIPLAILSLSLLAIVVAIRAGYLSGWYFASVLLVWLIYAASAVWLVSTAVPPVPIPFWAYFMGVALLLVPLASAAFAPLALASHRHA